MNLFTNPIEYWKSSSKYHETIGDRFNTVYWILEHWMREIKYAWQRAYRGYDQTELWCHHAVHTERMLEILKHYRHNKVGSPIVLLEDEDYEIGEKQDFDIHKRWDAVLDRMIAGFESADKFDSHLVDNENVDFYLEIMHDGLDLYGDNYLGLWD